MKNLKTTLFVIAISVVLLQTIRHLYVRFYYNQHSVLDKYTDTEEDKYIKNSTSIDSLLLKFDKAYKAVEIFEKGKTKNQIDSLKQTYEKLYDIKSSYRQAIEDWESKENKLHEAIRFWLCGLILVVGGGIIYFRKVKWIGLALIITGLTEMVWWSSPDLTLNGATLEFLKYLNVKLILSAITLIVIILLWLGDKNE